MTDLKGDITFVNRGFCLTTGYEEKEVIGKNPRILKSGEMPAAVYKEMWESLSQGRQWQGELRTRRKNGELFWESAVISPVTDEEGKITHYVAVKEDITKRKRAEEQLNAYAAAMAESNHALEQSNRRAEAANRSKSEFLANMSHEIRTPMTAILGYAEILADSVERPEQQEAVQTIKRNSNHLLGLVNDILDLSKIEAGKVQVENLQVSPLAVLGDVVSLMRVRSRGQETPLEAGVLRPHPADPFKPIPRGCGKSSSTWWAMPSSSPRPAGSPSPSACSGTMYPCRRHRRAQTPVPGDRHGRGDESPES